MGKRGRQQLMGFMEPPIIPPIYKRETPATSWDEGTHCIASYMEKTDLALLLVTRNQNRVPQQELDELAEQVKEAQLISRANALEVLDNAKRNKGLNQRLRRSIASILGHEHRREKTKKKNVKPFWIEDS